MTIRRWPFFAAVISLVLAGVVGGCSLPTFLVRPVANSDKLEEITLREGGRAKVAIIPVEGLLANAKTGGGLLKPEENPVSLFVQQLHRAAADESVKAVVLRVNSPGGTVTGSDTMYEELLRFKKKTGKPVIASFQEVAASGAYYVACGADRIVTQPTSIVGSIGVIFQTFQIDGTLAKLGVTATAIKSAEMKDMASPFVPITPAAREVTQHIVDEFYARFVGIVTASRHLADSPDLKTLTDGRVFSGTDAKKYGLADEVGTLEDALALARSAATVPDARAIAYKRPYGYQGSIYADTSTPAPQANVLKLELPEATTPLPRGFYYLWQ